jgi:hypothetical protein
VHIGNEGMFRGVGAILFFALASGDNWHRVVGAILLTLASCNNWHFDLYLGFIILI